MIARKRRLIIRCANAAGIALTLLLAVFLLHSSYTSATQVKTAEQAPAFRSSARMVLIDVLVTDKDGNPVRGLTKDDFALKDDGAVQRISGFEEYQRETPSEVRAPFKLNANSHTNWVESPSNGAVNIVVLDLLNTFAADRSYGRKQLLNLLKNLPAGQQLALFTLDTRLHMVQDFTTNSDVLIDAARNLSLGSGPLSATADELDSILSNVGTTRPAKDLYVTMMDTRIAYTLDALRDLAKATASLPGRKNVIWLTTGFPMTITGTMLTGGRVSNVLRERDYSDNIRITAAALASSQIAIYPIDLRGLVAPGTVANRSVSSQLASFAGFDERDTMKTIAEETGGRAYYDKNDLDFGIREVLTKGSSYYTLAYSPRNIKWNGDYHKVSVKLAHKGLRLTYRRGYHAVGDSPLTEEQASRSMGEALGLDTMDSRMIVLAAEVAQPEAPGQPLRIKYNIDPNMLVFDEAADQTRNSAIAVAAVAWDAQKHRAADIATKVEPVLKPAEWAKARTYGIPWTLELPLQPGSYTLKLAVVDLKSGKTGSLSIPLKLEGNPQASVPAKNVP